MKQSKTAAAKDAENKIAMPARKITTGGLAADDDTRWLSVSEAGIVECVDVKNNYVAIAPLSPDAVTSGGLLLPSTDKVPDIGVVMGSGPSVTKEDEINFKDIVKFSPKQQVGELTDDLDVDYKVLIIKSTSVLAKIGKAV